jgi:hypothetical protein
VDAIAAPFVQGKLRNEYLAVNIQTECAHCKQPIELEVDSELNCKVITPGADPVVFAPMVNFDRLKDPSIIDAF